MLGNRCTEEPFASFRKKHFNVMWVCFVWKPWNEGEAQRELHAEDPEAGAHQQADRRQNDVPERLQGKQVLLILYFNIFH